MAEVQHYVPRFLLKHFSVPLNKSQIFVFDKHEERSFKSNIKNVAAEKGFYNIEIKGKLFTLEPALGDFEDSASLIINEIVKEEKLPEPGSHKRLFLAAFVTVQFLRVNRPRKEFAELNAALSKQFHSMGLDPTEVEGFTVMDENVIKQVSMKLLASSSDFIPYFYDKTWVLLKTPNSHTFWISDNPVTLQNKNDFGLYGNLGLGVKGIEVYMPISKRLSLGIICRSYEETFRNSYTRYVQLKQRRPEVLEKLGSMAIWFEQYIEGMDTGRAITMLPDNVVNLNSLQVKFSSRSIYSSSDEFTLVRQMIADNPQVKKGRQLIVR